MSESSNGTRNGHGFVGVDADEFPYDVETHVRYHRDLPDETDARHPHLPQLSIDRFDSRTAEIADEYAIEREKGARSALKRGFSALVGCCRVRT
ncbi:hypothetical protein [Natronorubrum halophilum]|uniref:hypothetical protein n=1 Tax=Natronorubrum halophilum TaxID=1702106 RepID=UPI001EE90DEE|nr:hypothetical protein [Natronorubrum halophilum]